MTASLKENFGQIELLIMQPRIRHAELCSSSLDGKKATKEETRLTQECNVMYLDDEIEIDDHIVVEEINNCSRQFNPKITVFVTVNRNRN
jgi:hypothetical protein